MLFLHAPNPHVSTALTLSQPTSSYPSRNAPVTSLWSLPIHLLIVAAYVRASFCTSSTPRTGRTRLRSPSESPIVWSTICSIRLCPKDQLTTCHSQHADTRGVTASCHLQAAPTFGFHASMSFPAAPSHLCCQPSRQLPAPRRWLPIMMTRSRF